MKCRTCDSTGYVTVKTPCKEPGYCREGGPSDGVHEITILCPCCQDEEYDEDDSDEDDDEEEEGEDED
jgi:hypothetical protein